MMTGGTATSETGHDRTYAHFATFGRTLDPGELLLDVDVCLIHDERGKGKRVVVDRPHRPLWPPSQSSRSLGRHMTRRSIRQS